MSFSIIYFSFLSYLYCILSNEERIVFLYPLIKNEFSSIFYLLKYFLPKKTFLYTVNNVIFYLLFFKLRIYDFYYEIIYNNISFDIFFTPFYIEHAQSNCSNHFISASGEDILNDNWCNNCYSTNYYLSYILVLSCYVVYTLNLYWFLIMNKILYKSIIKFININTDILYHQLSSYLHWVNIPVSMYIYSYNPNKKHIFDIIGITILSISSYRYHYDIYRRLFNKEITDYYIPNKDNILLFLHDNIAINMRSFFVVLTNYYYNVNLCNILLLSGTFHIVSIYLCFINILELFIHSDINKERFVNCHNLVSVLPIACDVLLISTNSPIEIVIPFLFVNIVISFLFIVEPFYKLTQAGFHMLLILQTYYMCLSNIK